MEFEYVRAEDLDRAWLNFELDLPLEPLPDGQPNPFYVDRPGNPVNELVDALLAPYFQPPKFFFSGHRGCGKSTELRRTVVNTAITGKYYPVHFSIRDEADINNLDFKDVLLAIGGRMYRSYREQGHRLPQQLENELETWRGKVEEEIVRGSRFSGVELNGSLDAFFASTGLRMKIEPATRRELRQVIERDVIGLVDVINKIAIAIQAQENRMPLILIDDLDKPDLNTAREIFHGHRETMLQPNCAIVYTVSSPLFYRPEFEAIRDRAIFLPNVKLHEQGQARHQRDGYKTMQEFAGKRMNTDLITSRALNEAVRVSGGVFREMARVMRSSIRRARRDGKIELGHVHNAEAEIRGEYRRLLTAEQRTLLKKVYADNQLDDPDKIGPLLQILAILEYANGEPWCDVHPALVPLLEVEIKAEEEESEPPA
jgi:hypothetical protein